MKKRKKDKFAVLLISIVMALFFGLASAAIYIKIKKQGITEYCVFLIDVTSELTPTQKGKIDNEFDRYLKDAPKNSKHFFYKVGEVNESLLNPVATAISNYSSEDDNILISNPKKLKKDFEENVKAPLDNALKNSLENGGSKTSPILESIQSVVIKSLGHYDAKYAKKRIILVSDLMQNTDSISFYDNIPDYDSLVGKSDYRKLQADFSGIGFEIWQINPQNGKNNSKLLNLWKKIIYAQNGEIKEKGIIPIF